MKNNPLAIFFAIPLLIGISIGWNKPQATMDMSLMQTLLYWCVLWSIMWIVSFSLSHQFFCYSRIAMRHRRITQFVAAFITSALLRVFMPILVILINSLSSAPSPVALNFVSDFGFYPSNLQQLGQYIYHGAFPITVWMVVNLAFDFMGTNLYASASKKQRNSDKQNLLSTQQNGANFDTTVQQAPYSNTPVFLNNTPNINVNDIIAISAEDHYVRVVTNSKAALIYCRFSDCLYEMQGVEGIRIHRSHWARKDAINKIERQGRKAMVRFTNGLTLPVSHTYLGSLEQVRAA